MKRFIIVITIVFKQKIYNYHKQLEEEDSPPQEDIIASVILGAIAFMPGKFGEDGGTALRDIMQLLMELAPTDKNALKFFIDKISSKGFLIDYSVIEITDGDMKLVPRIAHS